MTCLDNVYYSNSVIYKLYCKDPAITDLYIGSTTNFRRRKYGHKTCCNNEKLKTYNLNVYKFIRENGNWDNWDMIQIESCNVDNKRELHLREKYWIETLQSSLNKSIPTQTRKEHDEKNKEVLAEKKKEYEKKNKEVIAKRMSIKVICICGSEVTKRQLNRHQQTKKHKKYLEII